MFVLDAASVPEAAAAMSPASAGGRLIPAEALEKCCERSVEAGFRYEQTAHRGIWLVEHVRLAKHVRDAKARCQAEGGPGRDIPLRAAVAGKYGIAGPC